MSIPPLEHEYPRPQLRRAWWQSLDGPWEFAIDGDTRSASPDDVAFDRTIAVPFAPETPASGIGDTSLYANVWYRRTFDAPSLAVGERLILHFGAVDYEATVWVNGHVVARHEGGYTPFEADITRALTHAGSQTVIVHAHDDPHDLAKPRGKQDWQREPHAIWYPRTTGIWQTVWLEKVPSTAISRLRWTSNLECWEIGVEVEIDGERRDDVRLRLRLRAHGALLAEDTYRFVRGEVTRRIALADPGIDDYRNELLWAPTHPTLIEAELELLDADGSVIDAVASYTALRAVGTQGDRFMLNGRAYQLRMALDQGYWPESGLTAPGGEALRRDIELAKAMGFNGVRKHQKIEDPRYLYWADRLGLLVWGEMPSAYRFTRRSIERVTRQWTEVIERDYSHPCIVAWVPFNESWGVPDLPSMEAQRQYVQAMYSLTKTLDPDRPVIGNDGWEMLATDIVGIHDYDPDPGRMARRYESHEVIPQLLERERPSGRLLSLNGHDATVPAPLMLTEFGGIGYSAGVGTWGYVRAKTTEELRERYEALLEAVRAAPIFSGFCYTQFADTYQEANGLLFADRTPKFPLDAMKRITRGRGNLRGPFTARESPPGSTLPASD